MLLANWRRIFVCYVFIHVLDRPAHMILGFLNIVRHFGKAPSTAAKSDEYVKIQAKLEFAIHDGLYPKPVMNCKSNSKPMTTVAPPVHIFHLIFKQFISDANDPHLDLPREFLIQVQEFVSFTSQRKTSEPASNPEWRQFLSKLSKVGIHGDHNADGTHPDGISTIDITALGESVPFFIWEYKRILGEGGCDPSVQVDPARCEFYCSKYHDDLT